MTKEELGKMAVASLRELAKERGIRGVSSMRKNDLVNVLLQAQEESVRRNRNDQDQADGGENDVPMPAVIPGGDAGRNDPSAGPGSAGDVKTGLAGNASPEMEENTPSGTGENTPSGTGENTSVSMAENAQAGTQPRKTVQPRQDQHARVIVRRSPGQTSQAKTGSGGTAQTRMNPGQTLQGRVNNPGQTPPGRINPGQVPQGRTMNPGQVPQGRTMNPGQAPQGRTMNPGQAPQGRTMNAGQAPQGRVNPGQAPQTRTIPGEIPPARVIRPSAPMTRGEMYQSNPQPKAEPPEGLLDRADQDRPPMELKQLDSGNEVSGVLEVMSDGYGFIRSNNYLPGEDDVYVSPSQIRKFGLKTGDIVCGNTRVHAQQEKFSALLFVKLINGCTPSEAAKRYDFEHMTPVFPNERLRMERTGREIAMRIVDLLAPIGKGQRGLIVSPPKAGKTTLLKDIARSILRNNPEMHIIIMLIDERPEEVTDIREAIVGDNVEVLDSTFDETPEHHRRVAEMGIERARRLVEHCRDVVILLDSITRLARAYNLIVPPSGRTLSGGLDPAALHPPKRFFGAARNMREGGSLTILATALVDTGSKMDDVVYEEFKGTGNMELILDRKLSERRVFPAIDIQKSGTRREDLLLTPDEGEASYVMRKAMNGMKGEDAVERILDMFARTRSNEELIQRVKHSHVV